MREKYQKFFEMANISSVKTGLSGIVQIRPEDRHAYFPHIHYVRNVKKADFEFIKLSLSKKEEDIQILENKNFKISSKEIKKLKEFIVKNYSKLVTFYTKAEYIQDTSDFLSSFEKV